MRSAQAVATRMLKRNGIVDGEGRIFNFDTGTYELGYTEVNSMATTPFSRTKTHKAWFSGEANIKPGDLIQDRVDSLTYIVMALKTQYTGGRVAYLDGTLYWANSLLDVYKYDTDNKDNFGRPTNSFVKVYSSVPAMVNPLTLDAKESEIGMIDTGKIKIAIQSKNEIKLGYRLVSSSGDKYVVRSIDNTSLEGIYTLSVEIDVR